MCLTTVPATDLWFEISKIWRGLAWGFLPHGITCRAGTKVGRQTQARREASNAKARPMLLLLVQLQQGAGAGLLTELFVAAAKIDTFQCAHSCTALPQVRHAGCCHLQLRGAGNHHMLPLKQACLDQPVTLMPEPAGEETAML